MLTLSRRFSWSLARAALRQDERGISTVEYIIILLLIAVFAIGSWQIFGATLHGRIKQSHQAITGIRPETVAPNETTRR